MSSQAIGQRFRVSRGGCWQCGSDCRSRLADALRFFQVAYNVELADRPRSGGWRQAEVRCHREKANAQSPRTKIRQRYQGPRSTEIQQNPARLRTQKRAAANAANDFYDFKGSKLVST